MRVTIMYEYLESGLKNIFLVNGYRIKTTTYGKAVAIEDVEGLHETIARCLIEDKKHLTGPEFRFIRKFLDMSQKRIGELAGVGELTIHNWEKRSRLPKWADRWIRLFLIRKCGDSDFSELVDRLNSIDRDEMAKRWMFEDTAEGWRPAA